MILIHLFKRRFWENSHFHCLLITIDQKEVFPTKHYPTPSQCSFLNFLFHICHGPIISKTAEQCTRVCKCWCVLAPKCQQSCAREHTAALAASIEFVGSRERCFVHGIGDQYNTGANGVLWMKMRTLPMRVKMNNMRLIKLEVPRTWSSEECGYRKEMDYMDSMSHFNRQEKLVLAILLEKSTREWTKHCPLPRAGLHAPFERISTACPVSR